MVARFRGSMPTAVEWLVPILLVLLIPVGAALYVGDHNAKLRLYRSSVKACERGNLLRVRINTKLAVYDEAWAGVAAALSASKTAVGKDLYRVTFKAAVTAPEPLPLTDCAGAYDPPRWFWERGVSE